MPVGGITTRPSSPNFINNCRISATDVLAGKFFARIIVLDLCVTTWNRNTDTAQCLITATFLQMFQHVVEFECNICKIKVFNHVTFNVTDPNLVMPPV
jgi:hypothetical protein